MVRLKTGTKWPPGRALCAALAVLALALLAGPAGAYVRFDKARPGGGPRLQDLDLKTHDVNAVFLMVSNQGPIGLNMQTGNGTGFFPSNTSNNYVFGTGLWFGAKFDADGDGVQDKVFTEGYNPLAGDSEFREGNNDQDKDDPLTRVFDSTDPDDLADWPDAFRVDGEAFVRSDQDLVTTYTTKNKLPIFGVGSMPLEVNQRSMAYKTGLSAQAIFLNLDIVNWGDQPLQDAWVGYDNDMDVGAAFDDDLTSFIVNRITPEGDTVRVNMAYAWDSDFNETNFTGTPGFVGIAYLRSPGNPNDGIDNDGDGLVDESPFNGIDDDGDGKVDEADEVDELGLVNYSKHCNPSAPCQVNDPEDDPTGYDLIDCISANNPNSSSQFDCLESTTPADVRFMMSSGPFDWEAGQSQQVVLAMVFANAVGEPSQLDFVGNPPRPDPNDPALGELLEVRDVIQGVFDLDFKQAAPPPAPNMTLVPGDGQVTILWDDLSLQTPDRTYDDFVLLDPEYRKYDFQGYRVWRSRTGAFSRRGDINDPNFPLTPEAQEENDLVDGFDLTLLAQYDLADGITTESDGVTCADSLVLADSSVAHTNCDTFNLGSDTGLRFSYVDRGDPGAPLVNGFRYFYSVTAYDMNSDALPVARRSLDSGVLFPPENSVVPARMTDRRTVDADFFPVDSDGNALDDTSATIDPETGEPVDLSVDVASNAVVEFSFADFDPERIASSEHTLILDTFERIDAATSHIEYHIENGTGATVYSGDASNFDLPYDGEDRVVSVTAFDVGTALYSADLTFNVDSGGFVVPDPTTSLLTVDGQGQDISGSLGNVQISPGDFVPMGYRASDIRMEWVAAGDTALTLDVADLDNAVDVPFGEGIVDESGAEVAQEKGTNWSFLPDVAAGQPGGRYFLTDTGRPIVNASLWVAGVKVRTVVMSRAPQAGDVWTLRETARVMTVDTSVTPPDTLFTDARRPPVPGMRYRLKMSAARDEIPPEFTIGIFQNTLLTNHLDLYVVASEALDAAPALSVGVADVGLTKMTSETVEIYTAPYVLSESGLFQVAVRGSDTSGNEGEGTEDVSVGQIFRSGGGVLLSPDRVLRLMVPPESIRDASRFFLCTSDREGGGGADEPVPAMILASGGNASPVFTGTRGGAVTAPVPEIRGRAIGESRSILDRAPVIAGDRPIRAGRLTKRGDGADAPVDPALMTEPGLPLSPIYSLSPGGERLLRPAELSMDLDALDLRDEEREGVALYRLDGADWVEVESRLDAAANRLTASVGRLGSYQLRSSGTPLSSPLPRAYRLAQNYPNPFNPSTAIAFDIPPGRGPVWTELVVYNLRGQRVRTLLEGMKAPGSYAVQWDGEDGRGRSMASGIYLYRLEAGDFASTRRMVMIK